jgi:hypothetical protein
MAVGPTLREALDTSFGYLSKKGYCVDGGGANGSGVNGGSGGGNGTCHVFPVAIGEFGSRLTDREVGGWRLAFWDGGSPETRIP